MMEFGSRSEFAITLELIDNYHGPWLFGKFCYWIHSERMGDWDTITSLRDVLLQMQPQVKDSGTRYDSTLCGLFRDKVFDILDTALYGNDDIPRIPWAKLPEDFGKFEIRIPVETFDGWGMYLVDCDHVSRVFVRRPAESVILEYTLTRGEFDRVIRATYDAIDLLLQKEIAKEEGGKNLSPKEN